MFREIAVSPEDPMEHRNKLGGEKQDICKVTGGGKIQRPLCFKMVRGIIS
jgi:hypothetical protein